ncbi:hypothetical protein SEVIR_1G262350v4 [Setaria viridis]
MAAHGATVIIEQPLCWQPLTKKQTLLQNFFSWQCGGRFQTVSLLVLDTNSIRIDYAELQTCQNKSASAGVQSSYLDTGRDPGGAPSTPGRGRAAASAARRGSPTPPRPGRWLNPFPSSMRPLLVSPRRRQLPPAMATESKEETNKKQGPARQLLDHHQMQPGGLATLTRCVARADARHELPPRTCAPNLAADRSRIPTPRLVGVGDRRPPPCPCCG